MFGNKKIKWWLPWPYLGWVHTIYDFDQTLNAHNSKLPILTLCTKFWIDLWINKCLLWPKLLTITIIFATKRDFGKFWLFRCFRRGQSTNFPPKCCFFSTRLSSKIYQLQEKSLYTAEIIGPQKSVGHWEVHGNHTDLRIRTISEPINPILAIFGILKWPYWKYAYSKKIFVE